MHFGPTNMMLHFSVASLLQRQSSLVDSSRTFLMERMMHRVRRPLQSTCARQNKEVFPYDVPGTQPIELQTCDPNFTEVVPF